MKKLLLFLFFLLSTLMCRINAQTPHIVNIPGFDTYVGSNGGNFYESGGNEIRAGHFGKNSYGTDVTFRSWILWQNIKNFIPLGAQIQSVQLYIDFQPTGSTSNIEFRDFVLEGDYISDYNEIGSSTLFLTSPANASPFSITQLVNELQGIANNNGYNSVYLAIKNQDESDTSAYVSYPYNVVLHVTYEDNINVTQLDVNQSPFGQVGEWNGNSFDNKNVPFSFSQLAGSSVTLNSYQSFKSGTTERYLHWNGQSDVINPHTFTVPSGIVTYEADFGQAYSNVTINITSDGSSANGTIDFKDPWLIDYNDTTYGMRNQGINAPFKTHSTPFTPTTSTSNMGIFLNQTVNSGVYYSVQAPVTQTINGYTSFFQGWVSSPSGYATFQNANAASTPVVFTNSGATTVTAQYSTTTISTDLTIPAGTYNIAGNLTVQSGATLTLNSGVTLNFPAGTGLTVNGVLNSSGATFTSSAQSWNGITFNNSTNSSLQGGTISYASSPIIINNTSSISISGCTINNFSNSAGDAIQIYGSSPTITSVQINGQSSSGNGVRFASGSSGILGECTIQNLGNGNGVIIQGASTPTITGNSISNNYFHGITVFQNSGASPNINSNTITGNSANNYVGIYFQYSTGLIRGNYVSGYGYGIWCRYSSSPTTGGLGQEGANTITSNTYGITATDNSDPNFGNGLAPKNQYYGVCNSIYGNSQYDVISESGSTIYAQYNWWGQYPPDTSKFYLDGTSYLVDSYPETSSSDCPLNTYAATAAPTSSKSESASQLVVGSSLSLLQQALQARFSGDFYSAALICRTLLKDNNASAFYQKALTILYNIFQLSKDSSIVNDLTNYASGKDSIAIRAKELLASAYEGAGNLLAAETIANELVSSYPNSDAQQQGLLILASLSGYSHDYNSISASALDELIKNYSTYIDSGTIAALRVPGNLPAAKISEHPINKEIQNDNIHTYKLYDNFPNPFSAEG